MATKKTDEQKVMQIKPGSPEMEQFLSNGYPEIGTRAHAKEIIEGRKANPALIPWELAQKAEAFLAALDAVGKVIDPEPGRLDDGA